MRNVTIAVLIALFPSFSSAQSTLAWKFKAGDAFIYERVAKDKQATNIKGQTLKQEILSTWVYRFETLKSESESATLQVTLDQVSVQHATGPGNLDNKLLEKMKGAVFSITVSPRGEISALVGYDKVVDQIADKRDGLAKTIRQHFPEASIRHELQQIIVMLPKEPVAVGSRWQFEARPLPTPPVGEFLTTFHGALSSIDRAGHYHIDGILTGKYERPDPPAEFFRIVGGNVTMEKGQSSCIFDNERGRVISQQLTLEMKGELTIEIVGATTAAEVQLRRDVTTRLLPNPKE